MNIAEDRKLAAEAKALAEGATEGPWVASDYAGGGVDREINGRYQQTMFAAGNGCENRTADCRFVAASRTLVPDLADRLEKALDRVEELERERRGLLNEVDCRIEHGAESGGHLEYVRDRLRRQEEAENV